MKAKNFTPLFLHTHTQTGGRAAGIERLSGYSARYFSIVVQVCETCHSAQEAILRLGQLKQKKKLVNLKRRKAKRRMYLRYCIEVVK